MNCCHLHSIYSEIGGVIADACGGVFSSAQTVGDRTGRYQGDYGMGEG